MFKFGQPALDPSFIQLPSSASLAEVLEQFHEYHYVIIKVESYFVLERPLYSTLSQLDNRQAIRSVLALINWFPSQACSLKEIAGIRDWMRPLIILDRNHDIAGILPTEKLLSFLVNENIQLSAYFYTLAETVSDAVTAVNRNGEVICWNSAAEKTYGIPAEKIIGKKIGEHFMQESIMLHRILDEGRPVRQSYHRPTPDTHVLINASPIIEDNQVIGGIAAEHDITAIVRLHEELYSTLPRSEQYLPFSVIGMGAVIKQSLEVAKKVSEMQTPVLLIGETGTGKEMIAQTIHYNSQRRERQFLTVNCKALPAGLLDTELFGYQGGAFTGVPQLGKPGKLEEANAGTLYLEDIHSMPKEIQLKLLQFLKSNTFRRVGAGELIETNTRILASTSTDLKELRDLGAFNEDLYYQLNIITIQLPPLRERPEDIPELVQSFLREFAVHYSKPVPRIEQSAMLALMNYHWPGNIKELKAMIERAVILNDNGSISLGDLPQIIGQHIPQQAVVTSQPDTLLKVKVADHEEALIIEEALRKTYGNKSAAAKLLGISRGTLYNKMKDYGL